jgi:MerR family regulatory protein
VVDAQRDEASVGPMAPPEIGQRGLSAPWLAVTLDTPVTGEFIIRSMQLRLTIGDFSRMTHLSVKALRHYHEIGLLALRRRSSSRCSGDSPA